MVGIRDCIDSVKKASGDNLTDQEALDLLEGVERDRAKLAAGGKIDRAERQLRRMGRTRAEAIKRAAVLQRKHAAINAIKRDRLEGDIQRFRDAGLSFSDALQALFHGLNWRVQGVRKSAWSMSQAYEQRYVGGIMSRIAKERPHLERQLRDPAFNDRIGIEMEQLKPGGNVGITGDADAQFMAKLFSDYGEKSRRDLNALGADIGKLDGWMPHEHDGWRMARVSSADWVAKIKSKLDLQKTFPDVDDDQIDKILDEIYRTITTGKDRQITARQKGVVTGPANLAKSFGKERVLHFASTEDWLSYNREFGYGSVTATMFKHLNNAARKAGLMEVFGPNPKVMVGSLGDSLARRVRDDRSLSSRKARPEIERLGKVTSWPAFNVMTGAVNAPGNTLLARVGSGARNWEMLSKLMGAVLSALPSDPIILANNLRFQGKSLARAYGETFAGYFTGRGAGEQRELGFLLGEGYDALVDQLVSPYADFEAPTGALSRAVSFGFRISSLSGFTDVGRSVGVRIMAADMGQKSSSAWASLPERYRNVLKLQGITAEKWNVARRASWQGENGSRYLTPDRIADLADDDLMPLIADDLSAFEASVRDRAKQRKGSRGLTNRDNAQIAQQRARLLKRARHELELDFRRFFSDEIGFGVIEADDRARKFTTGGLAVGTPAGEAARIIMQFKTFPIAFQQRVLGRRIYSQPQDWSSAKGIRDNTLGMGELMGTLFVAGLFGSWAKDIAKGRSPKALWSQDEGVNYRTLLAAMLQSGGMGIYGDFLFAETNRFGRGLPETLAGPGFGDLFSIAELGLETLRGEVRGSEIVHTGLGLTPFINLWYTRAAADAAFLNAIKEGVSPGYMDRQEARLREDFGQSLLLPSLGVN